MKFLDLTKKNTHFIFFITLSACLLINSGSLGSGDAFRRLQVTHWLWMNVPQVLPPGTDITGLHGKQYAQWGIGQSLLMLPADIVSHFVTAHLHSGSMRANVQLAIISYLTFPLLNATAAVLAYLLLLELEFSPTESILGVVALVFATSFLPYAEFQQENSLMFFDLMGGFLGNILWLRTHKLYYLCFGVFCLGWSFLVRVTCIFDAFTVAAFVSVSILFGEQGSRKKSTELLQYIFTFGLFYAPFVIADRFYQWLRFGSFTTTYFAIQEAQARAADPALPSSYPYTTPFLHGFAGFLVSPAKSLFIFNPLIIVAALLVVRYRKSLDRYVIQFFCFGCFLLFADMCMYSRLAFWGGDSAWGPRYVLVASQMIALIGVPIFIKTYPLIKTGFEKILCWILIVGGCLVQFLGVLFDYNLEIFQRNQFHVKYVIVWQRLVNAVALSLGTFQSWGLDPGFAKEGDGKLIKLAFMPWRTEGLLPKAVSSILQVGWIIACMALFAVLLIFLIQIRNKNFRKVS